MGATRASSANRTLSKGYPGSSTNFGSGTILVLKKVPNSTPKTATLVPQLSVRCQAGGPTVEVDAKPFCLAHAAAVITATRNDPYTIATSSITDRAPSQETGNGSSRADHSRDSSACQTTAEMPAISS